MLISIVGSSAQQGTHEVVSIKKVSNNDGSEFVEKCDSWDLSKKDVVEIIKLSKKIDETEKHHFYYELPCNFEGEIEIEGATYSYEINAGSTFYLETPNGRDLYGCSSEECDQYFLLSGGNEEDVE